MAWQRRNGGHSSNSGHGTVMGVQTGKVVYYQTRSKTCRTCASGKNKKNDCRKNHTGSSKSMEPDVAVENNVKYNIYTEDDDARTQAHIRDQVPYMLKNIQIQYIQ